MPSSLSCTSCRTPIDVPADFSEPTIRCGICWTEVPVPKTATAPVLKPMSGVIPTAKPLPAGGSGLARPSGVQVAAALPSGAKPAAGMARLEALLHKAGSRIRPPAAAAPVKAVPAAPVAAAIPVPAAPVPVAAVALDAEPVVEIIEPEIVSDVPTIAPSAAPTTSAPPVIPSRSAKPKTGRRVDDDDDRKKKTTRYKSRGDRDDDDRHPPQRATRGGMLFFALIAGVTAFLVFGGAMFWVVSSALSGDDQDQANGQQPAAGNNFNPQPNPNPLPPFRVPDPAPQPVQRPVPNNPPPVNPGDGMPFDPGPMNPRRPANPPGQEIVWKPFTGDGFSALVPGDPRTNPRHWWHVHGTGAAARAGFVKADGKKYEVRIPGGMNVEMAYVDLPAQFEPDMKRFLTPFEQQNVVACQVSGLPGFEFTARTFGTEVKRAVLVNRRLYLFMAHAHPAFGFGNDEAKAAEARNKFLDSVKLEGGLGGGNDPGGRQNPGNDQDVGPGPAAAAKVDPFWTAVVLPDRNEILAFSPRLTAAGKQAGLVRRYTYPGFVPKNTYHLPYPVTSAVADEKSGKLVVAVGTRPDIVQKETERLVLIGDVQVYDLKPIFGGAVGERDDLKPVATVPFNARLAGLELVNGKAVVLSNAPNSNKAKPWRTRLTQIEPETGKTIGTDLELPDPAWRLRASADGTRLYVSETQLSPPGLPLWGVARNGAILVVDAKNWKRERTYSVPGLVYDMCVTGDGTILATAAAVGGRDVKLYAVPENGQTVDLNPADGQKVAYGYVALTPDGKRMVTSPPRDFGAAVFDVTNLDGPAGLKKAADVRSVKLQADAQAPVGGHFVISPDGKYAIFQVGVVMDLAKLPAN